MKKAVLRLDSAKERGHRITASLLDSVVFSVVGWVLVGMAAQAQDLENFARGFTPEKAYAIGDLDNVSLFNGNLSVSIPIGQEYPVGGGFSYRFNLNYNSNVWTYESQVTPSSDPNRYWEYQERIGHPAIDSNAGVGWSLHFGMVIPPKTELPSGMEWQNPDNRWLYVDSDSSQHFFYPQLHEGEDDMDDAVWYSRDGTYLRLIEVSSDEVVIEQPGGVRSTFNKTVFFQLWRLDRIEDRFGNYLSFDYQPAPGEFYWILTDSTGRSHTLVFGEGESTLKEIHLAAFDNTTATYTLNHDIEPVYICNEFIAGQSPVWYDLPLLAEVVLPDGSTYEMETTHGGTPQNLICGGGLTELTLPTLGTIGWEYGAWYLPAEGFTSADGCNEIGCNPALNQWFNIVQGLSVVKRTTTDPFGVTGTWRYDNEIWPQPIGFTTDPDDHPHETRTYVTFPDGSCSKHYFRANTRLTSALPQWDHGLPYTIDQSTGSLFDSVVQYAGSVDQGSGSPYDAQYKCDETAGPTRVQRVAYEHDELPQLPGVPYPPPPGTLYAHWHNTNRRLAEEQTVYVDDDNRFAGTVYSDFDGLGRYRTATTNGTFDAGNVRVTNTNYNPDVGSYSEQAPGAFTPPSTTDPWVLNTYDETSVTESASTHKQESCFEASTGFLERRRSLEGASQGADDVIVDFERDTDGNVRFERYYGGDAQSVANGDLCTIALSAADAQYEIEHDYTDAYGS